MRTTRLGSRARSARNSPSTNRFGLRLLLALAIIFIVTGFALTGFLIFRFTASDSWLSSTVAQQQKTVSKWPSAKQKSVLQAAQKYNRTLAELAARGQQPIAQQADPFTQLQVRRSSRSRIGSFRPQSDTLDAQYHRLLNEGDGMMGSIEIPEISVKLPIYHGTSDSVLQIGAGHIEGTSLPIGGESTHAVLAAHRGLPSAMMFTRIDELRKGDPFYIRTVGHTLAYRVDGIEVVGPNDKSRLRIEPGVDRVTLYTCTPYGVNTHRLLVSGVRAKIPAQVPPPSQAGPDWHKIFVYSGLVLLLLALLWLFIWLATRRPVAMQHGPMGRHARSYHFPHRVSRHGNVRQ